MGVWLESGLSRETRAVRLTTSTSPHNLWIIFHPANTSPRLHPISNQRNTGGWRMANGEGLSTNSRKLDWAREIRKGNEREKPKGSPDRKKNKSIKESFKEENERKKERGEIKEKGKKKKRKKKKRDEKGWWGQREMWREKGGK
jgi:hypothetical protein